MRKKRTLNELRQNKTYGYRAPEEKNVPDAPGEISEWWNSGAREQLQGMLKKIEVIDAKLEFLLKRLEEQE